jgi:hypothetical protein
VDDAESEEEQYVYLRESGVVMYTNMMRSVEELIEE